MGSPSIRNFTEGTLVIHASGTAWCGGNVNKDVWVTVMVDGVGYGTLSGGTVFCDGRRIAAKKYCLPGEVESFFC